MTANEIRVVDPYWAHRVSDDKAPLYIWLQEIAAQLADLNEKLKHTDYGTGGSYGNGIPVSIENNHLRPVGVKESNR